MEMNLDSIENAIPCQVTVDPENGVYTIRTFDTSGRTFADGHALLAWVKRNWEPLHFQDPTVYLHLLHSVKEEIGDFPS